MIELPCKLWSLLPVLVCIYTCHSLVQPKHVCRRSMPTICSVKGTGNSTCVCEISSYSSYAVNNEFPLYISCMSGQIRERLSDLKQESGSLQELWTRQQGRLSQMLQFQQFLRETKMVDDMSSAHEVGLEHFIA